MRRRALAVLLLLISSSCSNEHLPTSPTIPPTSTQPPPSTSSTGTLWGYVFDSTGRNCVQGATVEIIAGAHIGRQSFQKACDFDIGEGYGFVLPVGESLILRASAPGYISLERSTIVQSGGSYHFDFVLTRQPLEYPPVSPTTPH